MACIGHCNGKFAGNNRPLNEKCWAFARSFSFTIANRFAVLRFRTDVSFCGREVAPKERSNGDDGFRTAVDSAFVSESR